MRKTRNNRVKQYKTDERIKRSCFFVITPIWFVKTSELKSFASHIKTHQTAYGASASRGVPVYFPAIAGTNCAQPQRDGQAELTWATSNMLR